MLRTARPTHLQLLKDCGCDRTHLLPPRHRRRRRSRCCSRHVPAPLLKQPLQHHTLVLSLCDLAPLSGRESLEPRVEHTGRCRNSSASLSIGVSLGVIRSVDLRNKLGEVREVPWWTRQTQPVHDTPIHRSPGLPGIVCVITSRHGRGGALPGDGHYCRRRLARGAVCVSFIIPCLS